VAKNPLLVDHPLEMFLVQQLCLGEKEKDPLRSPWDQQCLVDEHYHTEIEHYTDDREDGSREDIAEAAGGYTACDSREEHEPKERLRSLRDLQSLAEHHHSEIARHTRDQDDGGSRDIDRPVGVHTACNSKEDTVNSPDRTGKLPSHEDS
jgi:hypothetical protein